ncbi:MAG TPA: DUF58 domain-containing protein [Burkholderiales bacterium]|nr:DUF58 domain-containing protein [Burkholderiales bacterium]
MLIPSRRLVLLSITLCASGLAVSFFKALAPVWLGAALLLLSSTLVDAARVRRIATPVASRQVAGSLPLGVTSEVGIRIENRLERPLSVDMFDLHPPQLDAEQLPQSVVLPASGWSELHYLIRPHERGDIEFGRVQLRITSPFGFWQIQRQAGQPETVRVYPDFARLSGFALMATDHRLSQIGVLQRRRRGEGMDFHQLREYREGDAQRQIDWKASARMQKMISREYQDERDQQIVILLDCGRRMIARDDAISHFDHVVNAALLLAYVGLRQGDAVGLLTMSGPARWLSPRKSRATVNTILNGVYDLQPTVAASDYHLAAQDLMQRVRKRALVVVLSNLRDEDDDTLAPALKLLKSRHLVLFASLRENILSRALASRVDTFDRAITHAAVAEYLHSRRQMFNRLEGLGATCVDVEPEQLPIALVNRYLEIKRSGRL